MGLLRTLSIGLVTAAATYALLSSSGCSTEAVGIDECRDIEEARCEAGAICGFVDDVDACKRFYRDQCLHGLPVASPGAPQVDRCVAAIGTAAACARDQTPLASCAVAVTPGTRLAEPCDLVLAPERLEPCSFLVPEADNNPTPTNDAQSEASTNDAASGGGAGGAPAQ
jgi:hypothetical protein